MIARFASIVILIPLGIVLFGCGGGGGSSRNARVQERAIATTRNSRALFAIAGLGMKGTRAPHPKMGRRAGLLLSVLRHTRAVPSGYDEELKLYYTVTLNADGSGRQDLFTDTAHTNKAGDFVWPAPTNYGAYPVTFQQTYRIGQGEFAGERGTLEITFNDASGNNGALHIINTNSQGEKIDSRLNLVNGVLTAQGRIETPSGDTWTETDVYEEDGEWVCRFDFPDGSWGETRGDEDEGLGQITYYGADGSVDAWGTYDEEGNADLTYEDGTNETVDVDEWSDDSFDDEAFWDDPIWDEIFSDDGSDDRSRRRSPTRKVAPRRPQSGQSDRSSTPLRLRAQTRGNRNMR
jgi:hypothetical protein